MANSDDDSGEDLSDHSRRQLVKRDQRIKGDASARVAHTLMALPASSIPKLELEEDLLEALTRARKITSMIARRREERAVSAALRRIDIPALEARMQSVAANGVADLRLFQAAEAWRERLIADAGALALFRKQFPPAVRLNLEMLITNAQRERTTGKPPGAARALFRSVIAAMKPVATEVADAGDAASYEE